MITRIAAVIFICAFTAAPQTNPSFDKPAEPTKYEWAKTPVKSGAFVHLQDGLALLYIHSGYVGASGVWVDAGRKNPPADHLSQISPAYALKAPVKRRRQ